MKNFQEVNTIVIGGINVDFVFTGYKKLLKAGELAESNTLKILPGGKSRNIAQMMARFKNKNQVSMIGKTTKDTFGLWKIPVEAMKKNGVNIDFIQYSQDESALPGIAAIPVFENGENQIFLNNGVNTQFSKEDIYKAESLFQEVGKNNGILVLALEMPISTAKEAFRMAKKYGVKIAVDTGGINQSHIEDYIDLFSIGIDFLKPNVHETEILTNIIVHDIYSAKQAAKEFQKISGVSTVLITTGEGGAYLIHNKRVNRFNFVFKTDYFVLI